MAILMWPPSDGSQNTITVSGRVYSASPGNSTAVSYIDVNILESNRWTTYQTSAGQVAVPIQTPVGVPTESFSVNGRVYVFPPGSTVNVASFDYPILEANGFISMTASASGGGVSVNTALPAITGAAQVGQTLTASTGSWANAPTSFTYQWKGNGTNISGAIASSYVPVTGDIGKTVTVSVTATNAMGSSTPATSAATSAVIAASGGIPVNSVAPAITGTAQVGSTLTAGNGTWTNTPTNFTYQWNRGGVNIAGATGNTLILLVADQGSAITVLVTAINGSGSSTPVTSAATSTVISSFPAITAPVSAIGIYSVIKIAGWAGNCLQVKRASDRATLDIGFAGNVVDWAAADAFAAGSVLEVPIWYDQSGNGNNFVNPTNDRAPLFNRESHFKGLRPLTTDLISLAPNPRSLSVTWAAAPNQNLMTIYSVGAPRSSFMYMSQFAGQNSGGTDQLSLVNNQNTSPSPFGIQQNRSGSNTGIGKCGISQLSTMIMSSGPTSLIDIDGVQVSIAAAASLSIPKMEIFGASSGGGTTYNYLGDKFFFAVYPTNDSAATVTANRATFLNAFSPNTPDHLMIYGGNSMQVGSKATKAKTLPWLSGFGRDTSDDAGSPFALASLPNWKVRNLGVSGRTLALEISDWSGGKYGNNVIDGSYARVIYFLGSNTNDLAATSFASTAAAQAAMDTTYANMMTHVATVKAAGVNGVVIQTCIPRTLFALGSGNFLEDARVYLNNKIITNAVANGYTVSDWTSVAPFNTQTGYTDTTKYATDGIHPIDAGYALLAPIDRAAILTA